MIIISNRSKALRNYKEYEWKVVRAAGDPEKLLLSNLTSKH